MLIVSLEAGCWTYFSPLPRSEVSSHCHCFTKVLSRNVYCPSARMKKVSIFGKYIFSHIIVRKHKPLFSTTKSLFYLFSLLLLSKGVCYHFSWELKLMGFGGNRRLNNCGEQGDPLLIS